MIHLKMLLLQENEATRKIQKGKIFHFPRDPFTWAGFGFALLHDDDKEEDNEKDEEDEVEEEEDKEEEDEVAEEEEVEGE